MFWPTLREEAYQIWHLSWPKGKKIELRSKPFHVIFYEAQAALSDWLPAHPASTRTLWQCLTSLLSHACQIWETSLTGALTQWGGVSGDASMIRTCGQSTMQRCSCNEGRVDVIGWDGGVEPGAFSLSVKWTNEGFERLSMLLWKVKMSSYFWQAKCLNLTLYVFLLSYVVSLQAIGLDLTFPCHKRTCLGNAP